MRGQTADDGRDGPRRRVVVKNAAPLATTVLAF